MLRFYLATGILFAFQVPIVSPGMVFRVLRVELYLYEVDMFGL